jgi:hypothetical protein
MNAGLCSLVTLPVLVLTKVLVKPEELVMLTPTSVVEIRPELVMFKLDEESRRIPLATSPATEIVPELLMLLLVVKAATMPYARSPPVMIVPELLVVLLDKLSKEIPIP